MKKLVECEATNDNITKEYTTLTDEMISVSKEKEEKSKIIKEKNKKWDALQRQKDEATARFDELHKQDESLHAELIETNKRRKANIASSKTVIFLFIILTKILTKN